MQGRGNRLLWSWGGGGGRERRVAIHKNRIYIKHPPPFPLPLSRRLWYLRAVSSSTFLLFFRMMMFRLLLPPMRWMIRLQLARFVVKKKKRIFFFFLYRARWNVMIQSIMEWWPTSTFFFGLMYRFWGMLTICLFAIHSIIERPAGRTPHFTDHRRDRAHSFAWNKFSFSLSLSRSFGRSFVFVLFFFVVVLFENKLRVE